MKPRSAKNAAEAAEISVRLCFLETVPLKQRRCRFGRVPGALPQTEISKLAGPSETKKGKDAKKGSSAQEEEAVAGKKVSGLQISKR